MRIRGPSKIVPMCGGGGVAASGSGLFRSLSGGIKTCRSLPWSEPSANTNVSQPSFPGSLVFSPRCGADGVRWYADSASSARWKARQSGDPYTRDAKLQMLKSRAAFKLLEMDSKYKLFKKGQTVVDLGYAPGGWSQIALERTKPHGRILGIDILPVQPPRGVSSFQGNFLSPVVRKMVKDYLVEYDHHHRKQISMSTISTSKVDAAHHTTDEENQPGEKSGLKPGESENVDAEVAAIIAKPSYIDAERSESAKAEHLEEDLEEVNGEEKKGRLVDVVLSDMCDPPEQTTGFSSRTLTRPFRVFERMMNTSGNNFRDHVGSMDLCTAALSFASDTLRTGGHFVCKFYPGVENKAFENKLKKMFGKVYREKPPASRPDSKESYFIALRRRANVTLVDVEPTTS